MQIILGERDLIRVRRALMITCAFVTKKHCVAAPLAYNLIWRITPTVIGYLGATKALGLAAFPQLKQQGSHKGAPSGI